MLYLLYADTDIVKDGVKFRSFLSEMSAERQKKVNACAFDADKRRSLTAGILMDAYLKTVGFREKYADYSVSETGRPYFSENNPEEIQKLYFSITHSGNIAAVLFSDCPAGVDIEEMKPGYTYVRIANRFFSQREKKLLLAEKNEKDAYRLFLKLYTEKESYYKCFFDKNIQNYVGIDIEEKQKEEHFFMYHPEISENYVLTVCALKDEIISERMIF